MEERKKKYKLTKTLMIMAQKIIHCGMLAVMWLALLLLFAPCLLIFSVGDDGEITVWNFIGVLWMAIIWRVFKKMSD